MKILIVEDNEKNRKLFTVILRSMGYDTLSAVDGEDGVRLAREERPDLVLMDIQMPKMDGLAAMTALKSDPATSAIPLIALTSYAMKGDREKFLAAGFNDYISKPIEKDSFLAAIAAVLEEKDPAGSGMEPETRGDG